MNSAYGFSAVASKQFTTAGADINLATTRPGYGTNPNTQNVNLRGSRALWITSATGDGNLNIEYENGTTDTIEIIQSTMPFLVPVQAWKIKSSSDSGIKGNVLY